MQIVDPSYSGDIDYHYIIQGHQYLALQTGYFKIKF